MSGGFDASTERAALIAVDLQNDFLHRSGAYARGGASSSTVTSVLEPSARLATAARLAGVPVVATQFTLVPGRTTEPLIAAHLHQMRPFLRSGDFAEGSWGHAPVDELGEPDTTVHKVAYSAFAHTRLGWWLEQVGVDHLVVCGIVTNGGVASTVHDAHVRGYSVTVVADACAAFDDEIHAATLRSLGTFARVVTSGEVVAGWAR